MKTSESRYVQDDLTEDQIRRVITFVLKHQPCFSKTQDKDHPHFDDYMNPYYYGLYDLYSTILTNNSKKHVDWEIELYAKSYINDQKETSSNSL